MLPSSFLPLLALVSLALAEPLHIPLIRRNANNTFDPHRFAVAAEHVRARYGYRRPQGLPSRRAGETVNIPTINQKSDSSYVAPITVGTPSQTFNVILDTGSSDLWLASSGCASCAGLPLFNPSSSSSLQEPGGQSQQVQIHYGSGQVAGTLAQDTISMGGFTVDPQMFLVVSDMSSGLLDDDTSGIMGLAFQSLASTGAVPFWEALTNAGQFAEPEIAFWLTRFINAPDPQDEEPGGALTLGGTNATLFQGQIEFLDLAGSNDESQATFWMLQMTSLTVNSNSISIPTGDSALSAIDTGTTLIGGPSQGVQNLYAAIDGSEPLSGEMEGFFAYPCQTTLDVSISFGGNSWPISPADMNLGEVGNGLCLGGIFDLGLGSSIGSGGGNPSWVVGDTFLKNVYSVFRSNPLSVGFAQLSNAAGGSGTPSPGPAISATFTQTGLPVPTGTFSFPGSEPTTSPSTGNPSGALGLKASSVAVSVCAAFSVAGAMLLLA